MSTIERRAVLVDSLLDDPGSMVRLVRENAPYWPVQRYIAGAASYEALSGQVTAPRADDSTDRGMFVAPIFRGDWAIGGEVLASPREQVASLLEHPTLVEAARTVFGGELVRPTTIYANLTWQLPFAQGAGHVDIPAFRGFDRSEHDVTFLTIMGLSGLFEPERVKTATAVSWFYDGTDGGFEYWPDGPGAEPVVHEGRITNTAVVADNDFMWHRVRPTGDPADGITALSLDHELVAVGDTSWEIVGGDGAVAGFEGADLRVSVSWKAIVFDDDADRRRHDEHTEDLDLAEVLARFTADLDTRGVAYRMPPEPETDPEFTATLARTYVSYPAAG